jgi:hypothetical protein
MLPLCERGDNLSRVRMDYARARVAFAVIAGSTRNPVPPSVTPPPQAISTALNSDPPAPDPVKLIMSATGFVARSALVQSFAGTYI